MSDSNPHHTGHRDRLRQRFLAGGAAALPDYELLEIILFQAIPRRDVKPLAKGLLARFGNLHAVVQASAERLQEIDGMTANAVVALKAIEAIGQRMTKEKTRDLPVLNSWDRVLEYCHARFAELLDEQFGVLFMNKKNHLLAEEMHLSGTVDQVAVYPREIVKQALAHGATALILVHNHPSGDPTPSPADIELTNAVLAAAKPLGIAVHDHLIIARGAHISFKSLGFI